MRLLTFLLLLPLVLSAQSDTLLTNAPLKIGVVHVPPYCIQDDAGNWDGMSVRLWRRVAEQLDLRYDYVTMTEEDEWMDDLANGSVDVVIHADLNAQKTERVNYTQRHHTSNLGVASKRKNSVVDTLQAFFSPSFFWVVGSVILLLLVVGVIMYFVERGHNEDDFGGERSLVEGIGSGFWWAGVTLTTIGYGDKAPRSLGGRAVAMIWMLIAIGISASLTAAIVNASNQQNSIQFPDDLEGKRVGVVRHSQASNFLEKRGVSFQELHHLTDGLQALNQDKLDLVVGSHTVLEYQAKNNRSLRASVESTKAAPVSFAFALRRDDPRYDAINRAVAEFITSSGWLAVQGQYVGE